MKFLILEDEAAASKNLKAILMKLMPESTILAVLESVGEAEYWIRNNPAPDLAFFDIQLSDDIVFNLFRKVNIHFPVVFITAYNQYAIRAFKVNSIDYILKPVNLDDVKYSLDQYNELITFNHEQRETRIISMLEEMKRENLKQYRKSFLVQFKEKLIPVQVNDIAYFYIEHGIVYGMTSRKDKYAINANLEDIEKQLNPNDFFRVNRQYILSRKTIKEISSYFNERLNIKVLPSPPTQIIVSKSKVTKFRSWMSS